MLTLRNLGNGIAPGTITAIKPGTWEQWVAQRRGLPPPLPSIELERTAAPLPQLPPPPPGLPQVFVPPPLPRLPEPGKPPTPSFPSQGQPITLTEWHPQSDPKWAAEALQKAAAIERHRQEFQAALHQWTTRLYADAKARAKLTVPGIVTNQKRFDLKRAIDTIQSQMIRNVPKNFPTQVWRCDLPGYVLNPNDIRSYDRGVAIVERGKDAYFYILQRARDTANQWAERDFRQGPPSSTVYESSRSGVVDALKEVGMNPYSNPGYRLDWNAYQALVRRAVNYAKAEFARHAMYDQAGYLVGPSNFPGMFPDADWEKSVMGFLTRKRYKRPEKPPEPETTPPPDLTQPPAFPIVQQPPPLLPAFTRPKAVYTVEQAAKLGASAALRILGLKQVNTAIKYEVYYIRRGMVKQWRKIETPGPPVPVDEYNPIAVQAVGQAKRIFQEGYADASKVSDRTWRKAIDAALKARNYRAI